MMKGTKYTSVFYSFMCSALITLLLSSCIKDDQDECGLDIQFRYTYNIQNANSFGQNASWVRVWIFDTGGKFVSQHWEEGDHILNDFKLHIPALATGDYTFVAWAHNTKEKGEYANFEFPDLKPGDTIENLTARLKRSDNTCNNRLNSLLNGTLKATVTGSTQTLTVDMMKCTNTIRIILMPYRAGQKLNDQDYEFIIEGKNGWLSYNASQYKEDLLTYRPYYKETLDADRTKGLATKAGEGIDNAVVAELNTSRMLYDTNPRLIIRHKDTQREVMNINLTWFLSLQAIGEHKSEWDNQEYLDRQDEYAMTFFVDGQTWMQTRILVNGWVLSLEDIGLN